MRKVVFLVLMVSMGAWGYDQKKTPLYQHLLKQARTLLDRRERLVGSLTEPASLEARRDRVREKILEMLGPFPEKTPLNARTVWSKDFGDHRIEGILFESQPGFYVTANLYLPTRGKPPYPAVLGPCGHMKDAKAGPIYQTCWINLARRGFVVFSFDPIGQGERMNYLDSDGNVRFWGTTEHTMLGVQSILLGYSYAREVIWDGIRALDYLTSRPEVDKTRIGCSGNSGGGTQTAYFMAVDRRIYCPAPSCYITSLRRLFETSGPQDAEQNLIGQVAMGIDHADYIEACLPRPVLICAASYDFFDIRGTWETYREAKNFYGRYGVPERVDIIEAPDKHGYTRPRRTAVYHWMARWLKGEVDEQPEPETKTKPVEDLRCTETGQVLTSIPGARKLSDLYREEAEKLRDDRRKYVLQGRDAQWIRDLVEACAIRPLPKDLEWVRRPVKQTDARLVREAYSAEVEKGFSLKVLFLHVPDSVTGEPVLWLDDALAGSENDGESPERLAQAGHPVLVLTPRGLERKDRLEGGELNRYFGEWQTNFLALHLGRPLLGQRVADIRAGIRFLEDHCPRANSIRVVARREAVPPALVTAVLENKLGPLILHETLVSWESVIGASHSVDLLSNAVPGILRIADIPDLIDVLSPRGVTIHSARTPEGRLLSDEELKEVYPNQVSRFTPPSPKKQVPDAGGGQ